MDLVHTLKVKRLQSVGRVGSVPVCLEVEWKDHLSSELRSFVCHCGKCGSEEQRTGGFLFNPFLGTGEDMCEVKEKCIAATPVASYFSLMTFEGQKQTFRSML